MDKTWLIDFLKMEHLEGHQDLQDVAETCGLETVKKLLGSCETLRLYIPKVLSLTSLLETVVAENKDYYSVAELHRKIGLSRDKIKELMQKPDKSSAD